MKFGKGEDCPRSQAPQGSPRLQTRLPSIPPNATDVMALPLTLKKPHTKYYNDRSENESCAKTSLPSTFKYVVSRSPRCNPWDQLRDPSSVDGKLSP